MCIPLIIARSLKYSHLIYLKYLFKKYINRKDVKISYDQEIALSANQNVNHTPGLQFLFLFNSEILISHQEFLIVHRKSSIPVGITVIMRLEIRTGPWKWLSPIRFNVSCPRCEGVAEELTCSRPSSSVEVGSVGVSGIGEIAHRR